MSPELSCHLIKNIHFFLLLEPPVLHFSQSQLEGDLAVGRGGYSENQDVS